jgi:hypothetical protein
VSNVWLVQDACIAEGPQMVTKCGAEGAWLQSSARPTLKQLLLSDAARAEFITLVVVTRNIADFNALGISVFNPFEFAG